MKLKVVVVSVLLAIVVFVSIESVHVDYFRSPANIYDEKSEKDDLNLESLLREIKENSLTSIAQTLEHLSSTHPEFLENHTFAFNSFSLHESSYENPRAIVFGKSADFVITFNGDKSQDGFDKLEVAQFNQEKNHHDFFEISFLGLVDENSKLVQVSDPGGPDGKCLQCHVRNKPIWDTYDIWPGIYGSVDGEPIRRTQKFLPNILAFSGKEYLAGEKKQWDRFSELRQSHKRYKWLPAPVVVKEHGVDWIRSASGGKFIPNTALSVALTRKNIKRILSLIKTKKELITQALASEVLFSLDCRSTRSDSLKEQVKKLDEKYATEIHKIEADLKSRLTGVLLKYSEAPYFDPNMLVAKLYYSNFWNKENPKRYSFLRSGNDQFTKDMFEIHECMQQNKINGIRAQSEIFENQFDYKGCIGKINPKLMKEIKLKDFFDWLIEERFVTAKTKADHIAVAAAIFNGNNVDVGTDTWSTLLHGEHNYSSGSGVEVRLFRNGFSDLVYPTPIRGDRNSFGEYRLSLKGKALSSNELEAYCSDLATKLNDDPN